MIMKRFEITAILTARFVVDAKNEEEARLMALNMPSETEWELAVENAPTRIYFEVDDIPSVRCCDLMDASNGHNSVLVSRINKAWCTRPDAFDDIVRFLATSEGEDTIMAKTSAYTRCHDYCQYCADDTDLRTIISYCRV